MRFVDQGWRQVDFHSSSPKSDGAVPHALGVSHAPSLHVFTPRMRLMIQCSRMQSRLTVQELAKRVGVVPSELVAIEEGRQFPSNRTLELLQTVLEVDLVPGGRAESAKKGDKR
tara:strand:+ start:1430 stop:1771 length:342 start_codon:yes stop_codon:yes gene_type:complete